MSARRTSARHNSVTEIREIRAAGNENKLCLKAQRYRNLSAHQKLHPACFKSADVIMGKGITSPHGAIECRVNAIRTKDRMNMLQKNYHKGKKRNMRTTGKREEKSLPL